MENNALLQEKVLLEWENILTTSFQKDQIESKISKIIDLPEDLIFENEFTKELLCCFDAELVWQKKWKQKIAEILWQKFISIRPSKKPLWVVFLAWPTWVWKTETVKALSKMLFWFEDGYTKIACENFQHDHTAWNLFWAPKWYVWYTDAPVFNNKALLSYYDAAKKWNTLNPLIKSVDWMNIILFDEIEKMHPSIYQQLLWMLDDWRVILWNWEVVSFRSSIIVFTSNLWQVDIEKNNSKITMWFIDSDKKTEAENIFKKAYEKTFSPEFRWRISDVVIYEKLTIQDCEEIINLQLKSYNSQLKKYYAEADYSVNLKQSVYDYVIQNWYSWEAWARDLVRFYLSNIEQKLDILFKSNSFANYYNEWETAVVHVEYIDWKVKLSLEQTSKEQNKINETLIKKEQRELDKNMDLNFIVDLNTAINSYMELYYLHSSWDVDIWDEIYFYKNKLRDFWLSDFEIEKLKIKANFAWLREFCMVDFLSVRKWNDFWWFDNRTISKIIERKIMSLYKRWLDDDAFIEISIDEVYKIIWKIINTELSSKQTFLLHSMIKKVFLDKYKIDC